MPGVVIRIVDPVTGETLDDGEPGEIQVAGPTMMSRYWHRPDETAAVLTADGHVRTGDVGRLDNGYLTLVDRLDDVIISGGENIYPLEVERALCEHPAVADVAVVGIPSDRWGETPLAVVQPVPGRMDEVTEAALTSFARERLASYKCPSVVVMREVLPRNPSGKVLKTVLREPYWQGRDRRIG